MDLVRVEAEGLRQALIKAAEDAKREGLLHYKVLPEFAVEVPRERQHGDLAANLALLLASQERRAPREIAGVLVDRLDLVDTWAREVTVAGPGFINFTLDHGWLYAALVAVDREGEAYGTCNDGAGRRVQVEFVSANPTGLLHMGNARGAALGDTLANLLAATGWQVQREYYINDAGNQIENFGRSLEARYLQALGHEAAFPDEGYHGADLMETVRRLIERDGDRYLKLDAAGRREKLVAFALEEKLSDIRRVLTEFGVTYDNWFSEQSLHDSGAVSETIAELEQRGHVYRQEGALWLACSAWGEEKDEVLVRSNGLPTYYAADIAYHRNKFQRGFDRVIDVWGADHHGHVARMKGAMAALGYDQERLQVVLLQLVRLFQGGEVVRMSKRTGRYISLGELIEEVGVDAARFFFVMRSADSHLDFDLDLARSQSAENPVYYVQYAHARIASILRQAASDGIDVPAAGQVDLALLREEAELELMRRLADFPGVVARAAQTLEPHRVTRFAQDLAAAFHVFYTSCRVLNAADLNLRAARLVLVRCTQITLQNTLKLLGVGAPERM